MMILYVIIGIGILIYVSTREGCGCIIGLALLLSILGIFIMPALGISGFIFTLLGLWLVRDKDEEDDYND